MANNPDVTVNKIMRYKLQLTNTQETAKILKILKKLKDLEVTLDVLAETGIGKTVNTLRKHELAGDFAKSLVRDWKKLVPKGTKSPCSEDAATHELPSVEKSNTGLPASKTDTNNNNNCEAQEREGGKTEHKKIKKKDVYSCKDTDQVKKQQISTNDFLNESKVIKDEKKNVFEQFQKQTKSLKSGDVSGKEKATSRKRKKYNRFSDGEPSDGGDDKKQFKVTKATCELQVEPSDKKGKDEEPSECPNKKKKKRNGDKRKGRSQNQLCETKNPKSTNKDNNNNDAEEPTMSFESYLNYDENLPKRTERLKPKKHRHKSKPFLIKAPSKVVKIDPEEIPVRPLPASLFPDSPPESASVSVIKIPVSPPLESWFPEALTSHQKNADKESDPCDILDESAIFTGQRLNKKMQVYSGAKTVFLPAMLSLYHQCIRTLQNNINLLYETGGVPFDILEPVLERCTPEQLLRIEEYNPIYIGETDHLWGKHCQRDFKDSKLQEYESWKEMYLRLSEERERKFKMLTKTIPSAQSTKPKGRQVKMAFIHSVAKPPRDVRIKQELHGTAVQQPQPKSSLKIQDNRARPTSKEPNARSSNSTTSASTSASDARKKTKVAPIMAKSLKAFKKHFGRR